jgi:hypothetical protein
MPAGQADAVRKIARALRTGTWRLSTNIGGTSSTENGEKEIFIFAHSRVILACRIFKRADSWEWEIDTSRNGILHGYGRHHAIPDRKLAEALAHTVLGYEIKRLVGESARVLARRRKLLRDS